MWLNGRRLVEEDFENYRMSLAFGLKLHCARGLFRNYENATRFELVGDLLKTAALCFSALLGATNIYANLTRNFVTHT